MGCNFSRKLYDILSLRALKFDHSGTSTKPEKNGSAVVDVLRL